MKTIKIRLTKNSEGEFEFRYNGSKITKTDEELAFILEKGIQDREISNGKKIVDKSYNKYVFDFHDSKEFKYLQEPVRIEIRIRNEYIEEALIILKMLDSLCTTTSYIKAKNLAKILAISLASVTFLSFAGKRIIERINDPLGTNEDSNKYSYQDKTCYEQMEVYYQKLKERADSGDIEAKKNYEKFLMNQELNAIYDDINTNGLKRK